MDILQFLTKSVDLLAESLNPVQTALEQSDQGLHCLPIIKLSVHYTLIQKRKVTFQAVPFKSILNITLQVCFRGGGGGGEMHAFLVAGVH